MDWGNNGATTRRQFLALTAGVAALGGAVVPPVFAQGMARGGLNFTDYRNSDALALAAGIRRGDFTAQEVLNTAIARAADVNPTINAIVEPLYDYARRQIAQGLPEGPFTGVPFLLKDLGMYLAGTKTTQGSRFYADYVPDHTQTLVQRYLDAGLVMMGKSASPEFGGTATTESTLFGETRNPWDLTRTSGGSSGGSSAAVAAGILPIANASDGGGSIRIPAACCGLFGLKTSRGRTPLGPQSPFSMMSVAHCVSRSVRDSAALLDATAGQEHGATGGPLPPQGTFLQASGRDPSPLRIGLVTQPFTSSPVHSDCLAAVDNSAKLCEQLGHWVEPIELPVDPAQFYAATGKVMGVGNVVRIQQRERQLGRAVTEADLEPRTWRRYQMYKHVTGAEHLEAIQALHRIGRDMSQLHQSYDVILSPTMALPPLELGRLALTRSDKGYETDVLGFSAFTMLSNATGAPAMSVPLYWNAAGLPIGVMFAADYGREALLLSLAGQLERAAPWFDRVPSL